LFLELFYLCSDSGKLRLVLLLFCAERTLQEQQGGKFAKTAAVFLPKGLDKK
jgi:hypothetical protein